MGVTPHLLNVYQRSKEVGSTDVSSASADGAGYKKRARERQDGKLKVLEEML